MDSRLALGFRAPEPEVYTPLDARVAVRASIVLEDRHQGRPSALRVALLLLGQWAEELVVRLGMPPARCQQDDESYGGDAARLSSALRSPRHGAGSSTESIIASSVASTAGKSALFAQAVKTIELMPPPDA